MNKKILALVLALALAVVCFAGCGGNTTEPADESGVQSNTEETSGDLPVLKIGGIGPITGSVAVYGNAVKNGMQIAADVFNENAEAHGYRIEINYQDDEGDQEKAVNAYNTLKDWGMQLLIGTVTTGPCLAVKEYSYADNIFQITPSGSAVDCTSYPNAFRVCFNDPNQGIASAKYIVDNAIAEKVAVIYNSSDAYSSGIYQKFIEEAATLGLDVVAEEAFTDDSKTDFSVQIQKVQESGADLLFLPIYYQEAALILQQSSQMGLDVQFFGCDGLDGIIDQLGDEGKDLAEGVMLLTPFAADAEDELTVSFVTEYQNRFGEIPNQFAADGYDAILAMVACFDENLAMVGADASETCDYLVDAMTKITVNGLTGEIVWSADGEPDKTPKAVKIENGVYVAM